MAVRNQIAYAVVLTAVGFIFGMFVRNRQLAQYELRQAMHHQQGQSRGGFARAVGTGSAFLLPATSEVPRHGETGSGQARGGWQDIKSREGNVLHEKVGDFLPRLPAGALSNIGAMLNCGEQRPVPLHRTILQAWRPVTLRIDLLQPQQVSPKRQQGKRVGAGHEKEQDARKKLLPLRHGKQQLGSALEMVKAPSASRNRHRHHHRYHQQQQHQQQQHQKQQPQKQQQQQSHPEEQKATPQHHQPDNWPFKAASQRNSNARVGIFQYQDYDPGSTTAHIAGPATVKCYAARHGYELYTDEPEEGRQQGDCSPSKYHRYSSASTARRCGG